MSKTLRWCILTAALFIVELDCEIYQDRPKIKTSDGDLIVEPAVDKNIHIRTNGPKSSIFFGNIDILKTHSAKLPNQFQPTENYDEYFNGPNGILARIEQLENKGTSISDASFYNVTLLWRRVNMLKSQVSNLENQLNSRPKDECDSAPCQHGGTCLNLIEGYHCLCPSNWEGQDCDVDVNECRNFADTDLGCQNGATCINRPGTYECLCKSGWFGLHCTRKAKDCSGGDFEMCGYGTCIPVPTGDGIKCICHQGWTSNVTNFACLTDINECESYQGPRCSISPRVECINLPGSFRCGQCPAGYEGDGYICNDVDECINNNNGGCSPLVKCHNTIGSRICGSCPPGYQGDGITCTFRGSCSINHGGCHPSAKCEESLSPSGQVSVCVCPEGMDGDGIGDMGCYVSTSNNSRGCESNPCGNQGRCHSLRSGYICLCYQGYSGAHCDKSNDACAINPCQNGGVCRRDDTTRFRCECTAQYSGHLCQVRLSSCGGILDNEEGSLTYPLLNTTSTYNNNAQCAWVIHTASDKVINVTFSKFNVELAPECSSDFLQIHDGRKSSNQLIGRFCGTSLPNGGNIVSSHNNLYLWFHSDGTIKRDGFALHWTSSKPVCGGEVNASTHGHISSPGSPGPYPPNRDCYWHLATTPGKRISLHFFILDIEIHSNCSFDYLAIYDGQQATDPLISKYCNSTQPAPVQSASSDILIHFHSDAYKSGKGFQMTYASIEGIPGCGGYYTTDKGEIACPTYNGLYQSNLLCEYKIKTSPDTKIKLDFKLFKLERTLECKYDYLKIYDGESSDSQVVGKFCGTTYPTTYTSSSNVIFIIFKSDNTVANEGFRINYEAICEKTLYGDSGIVKSPSYPFTYPFNKVCDYIIRTEPGKAIQLTFQDFDIEDSRYDDCNYDNIEIRDGPDANSTLLGRYCGSAAHTPPVQISTHNFMHLRFKSDSSLSGTGFYANYTTIETECGGIYRDTTGLINHPSGDAETYKANQSCLWILIAPEGMHIKLTWNRFDVEEIHDCSADYLQIIEIDENNEEYKLGDKYCGGQSPPALTSSTNKLKLNFVSDININNHGFSFSYTFLDERTHCGGYYIKSHGEIFSPGWPQPYEPDRDCTWVIKMPVGQQISLNFSSFDLERPIRGKCNSGDYLEIRNGASDTSPLFGKYCGNIQYKRIISLANVLHLHFHSDAYLGGSGFKIEWDGTINGCGGTLTSSHGLISSPNYPNHYQDNAECFYRIVTSAGSRINILFNDFELEESTACYADYVEIYDGRDTQASSLGKHCTMSEIGKIETTSNYAFIKFRSDFVTGGKGFSLTYTTICNNNLTGRYGVIESPDYPNIYPLRSRCLWNIQVAKGNRINVTFTHFDIRKSSLRGWRRPNSTVSQSCRLDYLEIKEHSGSSKKFCGKTLPGAITTEANSLQIEFASSFYAPRTGFRLEWVAYGCGGHIIKENSIVSLDKSLTRDREIECEWLIESPPGKSINITFGDIYMLESKNCTIDSIEIYNGQNAKAPLLSKICHQSPTSLESDSNYMFIRSVKQSTLKDVHFTSTFHFKKSKCGGNINSLSGYFYSKNYPKNYDNNLDCMWFIHVPPNHRIEINFIDIDLYYYTNLGYYSIHDSTDEDVCGDSILIYDNGIYNPSSNYTYRICPNSNETQIVTKYNDVVIQFKSDRYGTAKGFKANFTIACGAIISATEDGVITSNKFINHLNTSCVWTIIAPMPDQKISLTLTHISLPKDATVVTNRGCPSNFLRILDGDDINAPKIGEYCGRKVPKMMVSQGNAVTIVLGSYTGAITGTFSAHYSPVDNACGGTLVGEEGTIASPSYPNVYPANIDCEWTVNTSPGNKAYIIFEQLDLEYSDRCNEDYLEVREKDGAGNLLGVYCGNDIPANDTKASNIYIKFHSDTKSSGQGFLLHYSYLHENVIEGDYGEIASPLYPKHYVGDGEYNWRVFTSSGDNIVLTIDQLEIFSYGDISYNKLTIYDGYDQTASILEQFHGVLDERKIIQASSAVVYIILIMDAANTGSIFYLNWTKSTRNEELTEGQINCGSNQTELLLPGKIAVVQSPNYPEEYDNNLNCEWIYSTPRGRHLSIKFVDFNLEEIEACYADSISIYSADFTGNWKPVKENICTSTAASGDINSSNYMKIKFTTDKSVTKKGFRGKVTSKCGGLITDLSGELAPSWEDVFTEGGKLKCNWTIKVRPGRSIQLRFNHFNITNNNNNCFNSVILRNGDSVEAPFLESGRYCGYDHEKKTDIVTSSNALFVSYTSDYYSFPFSFQSFEIYYEEKNYECGTTSTLTIDNNWEIINSMNYPSIPVPYSECIWKFSGPPGEILRIDFMDIFDLDYTENCGTESIEIRDGSSSWSPLLKGPYCGEKPGTIKSTGNEMYIKYTTQLAEPRSGFKANISIDICGGTIIASSGIVKSPGYPQMQVFPEGTVCQWHIIGISKKVFRIYIEDIDLPWAQSRCASKLEFEEINPLNNTVTTLKTFCDDSITENESIIQTNDNKFTVKLTIGKSNEYDQISEKRGFQISFNASWPSCGGDITTSEGYVTTPNYPQETTLSFCNWNIVVPNKLRRIRLQLIDFNQEIQSISIYNDINFISEIQKIPSDDYDTQRSIYESVGNTLMIYVMLLPSLVYKSHRFKAKYTSDEEALCGGDISGTNEELFSPNLQNTYYCNWHYNNPIFTDEHSDTIYNTIFVKGTVNSSATHCFYLGSKIIFKAPASNKGLTFHQFFCKNTEVSLRIPSSALDISAMRIKNDSFNFHLNIKPQPCGGTVTVGEDPINIFNNIPIPYNDSLDCIWILIVPKNSRVEIRMQGYFTLDCQNEYVLVTHSLIQTEPVIGEYCKEKLMESPLSTHYSQMYIQYHSNIKDNNTTLTLTARTLTDQCGGLLTQSERVFTSPNYPKSYKANQECSWEIHAEVGYKISLQFVDRFVIEDTVNCTKDVVIVYDWKDDAYEEMGRICGRQVPLPYNSTNNRLKVIFRTDADINLDGFKVKWVPICGGRYLATEKEQILYSPGYPYYSRELDCFYEISSQNDQKLLVKFIYFELEGYLPECLYDNLTITAESSYDSLSKVLCGNNIPDDIRNYKNIQLRFKTDRYVIKKGFKISYSLFTCGGKVNGTTIIAPTTEGNNYDEDMNCTWYIEAPTSKIVVIKFLYIDLENQSECFNDYLALYDGTIVDDNKSLALLCGFINSTTVLRSTRNNMIVQFITDSSLNYKGFKAEIYFSYSENVGCGGNIKLNTSQSSHVLKSPLIGTNVVYENYLDCYWSISSPQNTVIKITFTKFHVSPCKTINQTAIEFSKCDCDLVEIYDGFNRNSLLMGTYCGDTIPPELITSDNMVSVRFSTDGELVSSGFEATLTVHQTLCGPSLISLTSTSQRFKSPGYDAGSIPRGLHCIYHLDNSDSWYSQIRITIVNLQLSPASLQAGEISRCNNDKLIISSTLSRSNATIGRDVIINSGNQDFFNHVFFYDSSIHFPSYFEICGQKESHDFYVYGRATINLITSPETDDVLYKGVEFEVEFVGFCGRNYTELQGRVVTSYDYGNSESDCYTLISVPENYTISLYILQISPEYWGREFYVEIFDGNNTNTKQLVKINSDYDDNYPVFSTGRYMLLHNHRYSGHHITYDINYVATDKGVGCGGKLSNIVGAVTSPYYPTTYRHKGICEWELETPVGTRIMITFKDFDLGVTCEQNYLQLVDSKGLVVRTFCSETPADYTSTDNYVKLVFYTTMNNSGKGWSVGFAGVQ